MGDEDRLCQCGYWQIGPTRRQPVFQGWGWWPAKPRNRGFDYFLDYMSHSNGHEHYPKEGLYSGSKQVWKNGKNIACSLDKCYTADLLRAAAKKWIIDNEQGDHADQSFFYVPGL